LEDPHVDDVQQGFFLKFASENNSSASPLSFALTIKGHLTKVKGRCVVLVIFRVEEVLR